MVVVAIIGITSVIAISSYLGRLEEIRVKGDVRALEQKIQVARMKAISTNVPHGIVFNRQKGTYVIFKDNAPPPSGNGKFTDVDAIISNNGINDGDTTTYDIIETPGGTFLPERLNRNNRFTCILGSKTENGFGTTKEYIIFEPTGRVNWLAADRAVIGNASFIAIQRRPDGSGERKLRGFVWINLNSGITETVLAQPASTEEITWCSR